MGLGDVYKRQGFNNLGSKNVLDRIKSNKQIGLLGINIGPNKDSDDRLGDYLDCFKTFQSVADYITINISSPNTEDLRNFHDQSKLSKLLEGINKNKQNLGSKIPSNRSRVIALSTIPRLTRPEEDR